MLQHRHVYPGLNNDEVCGWHDAARVHVKYPTAHDAIYEEREVEDKGKVKKAAKVTLSFNEWGEPLTPEDVDANVALYKNPPEYEEVSAVKEAEEVLKTAKVK